MNHLPNSFLGIDSVIPVLLDVQKAYKETHVRLESFYVFLKSGNIWWTRICYPAHGKIIWYLSRARTRVQNVKPNDRNLRSYRRILVLCTVNTVIVRLCRPCRGVRWNFCHLWLHFLNRRTTSSYSRYICSSL